MVVSIGNQHIPVIVQCQVRGLFIQFTVASTIAGKREDLFPINREFMNEGAWYGRFALVWIQHIELA